MSFLEFEFTFKRHCLRYATLSMASELQDLRQPTGAGILLNLVAEHEQIMDVNNFRPHFSPVSASFRPHYNHCRIMAMCASERSVPKLQNEWSFVKIG